jgi:predicted  nucleic acid-binding Zn-ribbon protein
MSHNEASSKYHNLKYAVLTICDCIESCTIEKVVKEKYLPQLEVLVSRLKEAKKELAKEMSNKKKQQERWAKQIGKLSSDAAIDETISEELRERITEKLKELAEGVRTHEDS